MSVLDEPISKFATKEVTSIAQTESIGYAIKTMVKHRFRRLLVHDSAGSLIGMVTGTDILGRIHKDGSFTVLNDNVEEIMSKTLISVPHTETLRNTVQIMFDSGISGIPLVKGSKPVGIFTEKDVILLNQLWSSEIDTLITSEDSIGRSIDEKHVLTNNHSIWQATDKFIQLSQRQILVKRANTQEFIGIITITKVLEALASKLLLIESEDTNINILHTTTIDHIELYPVLQRGLPILVSSIRIWLNSRGIEATPLYSMGKPLKLVTEKDLFGYLISRLNSE